MKCEKCLGVKGVDCDCACDTCGFINPVGGLENRQISARTKADTCDICAMLVPHNSPLDEVLRSMAVIGNLLRRDIEDAKSKH